MTEKKSHQDGSKAQGYINITGHTTQGQEQRKAEELDRKLLGKQVTIVVSYGGEAKVYTGQVRGMTQYWIYFVESDGTVHVLNKAFIVEYILPQSSSTTQPSQSTQGQGGGSGRQG